MGASGCPSHGRRMRYTDFTLGDPQNQYNWGKGDKGFVGWSWLPFPDLGNPGDGSEAGLDGVTWMSAQVISVSSDGFAMVCYHDDGTVEEQVHPDRIRKDGCFEERTQVYIDEENCD